VGIDLGYGKKLNWNIDIRPMYSIIDEIMEEKRCPPSID